METSAIKVISEKEHSSGVGAGFAKDSLSRPTGLS